MTHLIGICRKITSFSYCSSLTGVHIFFQKFSTKFKKSCNKIETTKNVNDIIITNDKNENNYYFLDEISEESPSSIQKGIQYENVNKFGKKANYFVTVNPLILKNVHNIVGVSVTPYSVGWARVNLQKKKLMEFNGNTLEFTDKENFNENDVFRIALEVKNKIPDSDIYIMEHFKIWRKSKKESIFEIQMLSMLTALFNGPDYDRKMKEKVIFQKRGVIDYLYELSIRNERISAGQKLQRILNEATKSTDFNSDFKTNLVVGNMSLSLNSDFVKKIFDSSPLERDACAIAFFLVMSFIELNCTANTLNINHDLHNDTQKNNKETCIKRKGKNRL